MAQYTTKFPKQRTNKGTTIITGKHITGDLVTSWFYCILVHVHRLCLTATLLQHMFMCVFLLQDEPGAKLRKVDKTDVTIVTSTATLEVNEDSTVPVASGSKPLGHAQNQAPMAGKPVATVPPMAASKTTTSTVSQPAVPNKPKVSMEVCLQSKKPIQITNNYWMR